VQQEDLLLGKYASSWSWCTVSSSLLSRAARLKGSRKDANGPVLEPQAISSSLTEPAMHIRLASMNKKGWMWA